MGSNDHHDVPDPKSVLDDVTRTLQRLQTATEKRVCVILWEEFNKFLTDTRREPMTDHDIEVEYGLITLLERLEEVLPFRSDELFDKAGRRR